AAAALRLRVTAPASATAGLVVNVGVTALDAFDNVATVYAGAVHFTSSDPAAVLPADATLTSGAGTFRVTLKTAGTASVTATDTLLATVTGTSTDVTVSPAAAAGFRVSAPATVPAGSAVNVTVTALDAFDNTDTAYAGSVSITSSDTLATLPAAAVLTNGAGTFSVTSFTAGDQTVTATGPHATSGSVTGTSAPIAVKALEAAVTLADLAAVYDGTAKAASATTTPAGLLATFSYDGVPLPLVTSGDLSACASAINRTLAVRVTGRASGNVVGNGVYAISSDLATAAVHAGALAVDETKVLSIAILADIGTYAGSTQNGVTSQAGGASPASFAILGEASGAYATFAPVDAGSYAVTATIVDPTFTGSAAGTLVISPAGLTVTGVVANNKTYDTTTLATLDVSAAVLAGVIGSDDVALDSSGATAAFATADAGTAKPVTASGFALTGTAAGNYMLVQPTGLAADILKATAIVTLGDLDHSYDGTAKSASVSTTPAGLATTVTYAGDAAAPSAIGSYEVAATVSDLNYTGSATATLTIVNSQPVITQQPQDQSVRNGGTVALSVSASSQTAVTYQWYFEGEPLSGATSAALTLNAIRRSQAGGYTVVVTNSAGSVTSGVATVTVEAVAYAGTYFGRITDGAASPAGEFALLVRDSGEAVLLAYLPATDAGYLVNATVNEDGEFTGASTQLASLEAGPVFRGRIIDGVLAGAVDEVALTFAADVSPATNWAAAGYYEAVGIGTVPLTIHLMIGTDGEVLAVTIIGAEAVGVTGALTESGSFDLTTADELKVSGNIDIGSGQIAGTVTMPDGTAVPIAGLIDTVPAVRRMANASGRAQVGTGDNVLIAGFVLQGTEPKTLLIRAAGPALGRYGVGATLARPQLTLYQGGDALATNAGWSTAANAAQIEEAATTIGAFEFRAGSADSAILTTLQPGAYTAMVSGADGGSGVSLVEVYDVSGNPARLVNLSTRGYVGQGEQVLIAGVIVTGNTPKKLLIRAVGPTLGGFGVTGGLADPRLRVYAGPAVIAQNDNWSGNAQVVAATAATGAFALPADSKDAAIVITLAPGAYTVLVDGVNGATGVTLVETYELP
ncbi:MAG TPA: MBG domain-containing protein, partial [Opitutaceae bacterium]